MGNLIISGKLDSFYFRESDKRVILGIEYYDDLMDMLEHITTDVTDELQEIYQGIELDRDFVKRVEKKLKLTLQDQSIMIKRVLPYSWELVESLRNLYSPVTLTENKIKFGDPLKIKATVVNFKRVEEGEGFPLAGILAECIIGDFKAPKFKGSTELDMDVFDSKADLSGVVLDVAYVDVDAEFEHIYNELLAHRCDRSDFVDEKNRLLKRQAVYNIIANKLLGKEITLEYDEYYGYSVWDMLIYIIDENYK